MGLISRVSSRTYRRKLKVKFNNKKCFLKLSRLLFDLCELLVDPETDRRPGSTTQCSQKVTSQTPTDLLFSSVFTWEPLVSPTSSTVEPTPNMPKSETPKCTLL